MSLDPNKMTAIAQAHNTYATIAGNGQILYYKDGVYLPNGEDVIAADIEEEMHGEMVTNHLISEVVGHIKRRTFVERDRFDIDNRIINMENGLYSLDTGLSPHTPKHLSLHKNPIKHNINTTCPNIDQFIKDVVPPEYVDTLYEIMGYALSPHKNLKKAVIFLGEKNSGKSVMIKLMECMVGRRATTHVLPTNIGSSIFGAAEYFGKQLNIVDDLGNTIIMDTGILKSVITGATIDGQFKYGQPFSFTPRVLCVFATNEVPKIEPFDDAYASRFSIISFPNTFEGDTDDPDLINKLTTSKELSGFFNKCMNALMKLENTHKFTNDKTLAERIKAYKYHATPMLQFIDEMCILEDRDDYVLKDDLYNQYVLWSRDKLIRVEDKKYLTISLDQMGCTTKRVITDDDERRPAYVGVRLKSGLGDY